MATIEPSQEPPPLGGFEGTADMETMTNTLTWDADGEWVSDANGNRNSVRRWGSREAAEAALRSLKNCSYCSDCSDCSNCSDCSGCSGCSECSDCSDCSYCSDCLDCSDCSNCSECSDCSNCSDCSYCSYCSDNNGKPMPVPKIENIDRAVYAAASQPGALDMSRWHCGTTHCRAGWVVALAGEAGRALESRHNTELAAMLIYRESGSPINPARFYDNDADALEDMRRRAEPSASQ